MNIHEQEKTENSIHLLSGGSEYHIEYPLFR